MTEDTKKPGKVICKHCGQALGFDAGETWRKTKKMRCPVCKNINWVMLDTTENCLFRLVEYEESGLTPTQVAAMFVLWNEASKIPELEKELKKWEEKLNELRSKK